jgi:3-oxoacid CoA-transferase B subunit
MGGNDEGEAVWFAEILISIGIIYFRKGGLMNENREKLVEKYWTTKLNIETIGMRVAKEFKDGDIVNLGRGIPGLVGNYVPSGVDIFWHGENGILGYGAAYSADEWREIDMTVHNSSIQWVRERPGMAIFDFGEALGMLRGHHVDAGVIGCFQVSEYGDLANWAFDYPPLNSGIGIGGSFELTTGPQKCIAVTTHLDKCGKSKIVRELTLPLTGAPQQVDLIVTDLAVIEVKGPKGKKEGLILREIAPGWTADEIRILTDAELKTITNPKVYEL